MFRGSILKKDIGSKIIEFEAPFTEFCLTAVAYHNFLARYTIAKFLSNILAQSRYC